LIDGGTMVAAGERVAVACNELIDENAVHWELNAISHELTPTSF